MLLSETKVELGYGIFKSIAEITMDTDSSIADPLSLVDKFKDYKFTSGDMKTEILKFLECNNYSGNLEEFWDAILHRLYTRGVSNIGGDYASTLFMRKEMNKRFVVPEVGVRVDPKTCDFNSVIMKFRKFYISYSKDTMMWRSGSCREFVKCSFSLFMKHNIDEVLKLSNDKGTVVRVNRDTLSLTDTLTQKRNEDYFNLDLSNTVRCIYEGSLVFFPARKGSSTGMYHDLFSVYVAINDERKSSFLNDRVRAIFYPNSSKIKQESFLTNGLYLPQIHTYSVSLGNDYKDKSYKSRKEICSLIVDKLGPSGDLDAREVTHLYKKIYSIMVNNSADKNQSQFDIGNTETIKNTVHRVILGMIYAKRLVVYCEANGIDYKQFPDEMFRTVDFSGRFRTTDDFLMLYKQEYTKGLIEGKSSSGLVTSSDDLFKSLAVSDRSLNFSYMIPLIERAEQRGVLRPDFVDKLAVVREFPIITCWVSMLHGLLSSNKQDTNMSDDEFLNNSTYMTITHKVLGELRDVLINDSNFINEKARYLIYAVNLKFSIYNHLVNLKSFMDDDKLSDLTLIQKISEGVVSKLPLSIKSDDDLNSLSGSRVIVSDEINKLEGKLKQLFTTYLSKGYLKNVLGVSFDPMLDLSYSDSTEVAISSCESSHSFNALNLVDKIVIMCDLVYPYLINGYTDCSGVSHTSTLGAEIRLYNNKINKLIGDSSESGIFINSKYGITEAHRRGAYYCYNNGKSNTSLEFDQFCSRCEKEFGFLIYEGSLYRHDGMLLHESGYLVNDSGEVKVSIGTELKTFG